MNDDGPNPHFGQLHLNVAGRISHCHTMFLCLQLPLLHITGGTPDKLHYLDTRGEWKDAAGGAVPDGERTCGCVGATWARPRSGFPAPRHFGYPIWDEDDVALFNVRLALHLLSPAIPSQPPHSLSKVRSGQRCLYRALRTTFKPFRLSYNYNSW